MKSIRLFKPFLGVIFISYLLSASLKVSAQSVAKGCLTGINYQAVALDEKGIALPGVDLAGQPIAQNAISVRFSILSGSPTGQVLYQEVQNTNTDANGLFSLVIGHGSVTGAGKYNLLDSIPWSVANQLMANR